LRARIIAVDSVRRREPTLAFPEGQRTSSAAPPLAFDPGCPEAAVADLGFDAGRCRALADHGHRRSPAAAQCTSACRCRGRSCGTAEFTAVMTGCRRPAHRPNVTAACARRDPVGRAAGVFQRRSRFAEPCASAVIFQNALIGLFHTHVCQWRTCSRARE
jgi:hypothetical protein